MDTIIDAMLNRLKADGDPRPARHLIDEAGRRELTIREALSLFCERQIGRKDERRNRDEHWLPLPFRARSSRRL